MFEGLSRLINRVPWLLTAAGALAAVLAGIGVVTLSQPFASGGFTNAQWQSVRAGDRLEAATGELQDGGLIALVQLDQDASAPASQATVQQVARTIAADRSINRVLTWYGSHDPRMLSSDHRSTFVVGMFKASTDDQSAAHRIQKTLDSNSRVTVGGAGIAGFQVNDTVPTDLGRAELLVFPIVFLLSLWIFRGVIAALLPLMVGGITIVCSFMVVSFLNAHVLPISIYALNLIIGLGLGLAIDYSLFITFRFREGLAKGLPVDEAMRQTVLHAGRTVLFSSLTVAAALAALTIFPLGFLYSMGIGGVVVALLASATALVVLTAVLRLLGGHVNALAPRRWQRSAAPSTHGFWYRLASGVMRRPLPVAVVAAGLLIVLGLPFSQIKFTSIDATDLPASFSSRQVYEQTLAGFPGTAGTTVLVVVEAPSTQAAGVAQYAAGLRSLAGVSGVSGPQPAGTDTWAIQVTSSATQFSSTAQHVVSEIRSQPAPFTVLVGGQSAQFVDLQDTLTQRLPLAVLWVAGTTVILLFLMTGSAILPLMSMLMNLLTLSATFGVLVLIFQAGRFQDLLRYTTQGALESTQPVLLFAIVFGLSTDYAVFLLTRIKEMHDRGLQSRPAIAAGLERTGRIVTAAALLFCVAIGAFGTSSIVFIKELGVGTAAGVLIDATVVRALLVPSLMGLLGRWNWWAPKPLQWVHSRLRLQEG
jgi:uncharacterized membrane protein YdfJ with MMPL/SSD domain